MNPRPEFKLLLHLARASLGAHEAGRARELLRGGIDWEYFLDLSWRHGLMPLVNQHLLGSFADSMPEVALKKIREDFRHNAARNLLLTAELCSILKALGESGVAAAAYKGPALALQVYGDVKLRSFVDLDVLIRARDAGKAGEVLTALGYSPHLTLTPAQEAMLSRSECDRVYLRDGRNLVLELHWAIAPPFFSVPLRTEDILSNLARVKMCGGEVGAPAPEDLLLLLCVNGAKDLWLALEPVCALGELVRAHTELNWGRVIESASRVRALRMLLLGLHLADRLLETPLPESIQKRISDDAAVKQLGDEVVSRLFADDMRAPTLVEKTRFRVRARESGRDKLRYCALRFFTPTYKDCSANLPASLSFLFYGMRLLRLLRAGVGRLTARHVLR